MNVNIRKLSPDATVPTYGTEGATGFDLYASADVIIAPGETVLIPTGLAFEIPVGYEMQIRPRSGVTYNTKLRVANSPGTIDADYRGEVSVLIDNIAEMFDAATVYVRGIDGEERDVPNSIGGFIMEDSYVIRKGERIAQGVIAPVTRVSFTETDEELSQTERGDGGFGSTGIGTKVGV